MQSGLFSAIQLTLFKSVSGLLRGQGCLFPLTAFMTSLKCDFWSVFWCISFCVITSVVEVLEKQYGNITKKRDWTLLCTSIQILGNLMIKQIWYG